MDKQHIKIQVVVGNRSGILSSLMRAIGDFGLMYYRKTSEPYQEKEILTITAVGALKGTRKDLIATIENISGVDVVQSITGLELELEVSSTEEASVAPNTIITVKKQLYAHDRITPEALKLAEQELASPLGLVAPLLVEMVAKKTKHVGDLFAVLAKELDEDEREKFLSVIKGVNITSLV